MKKSLVLLLFFSFFKYSGFCQTFPFLNVGSENPISISDGVIKSLIFSDSKSLTIYATKMNIGQKVSKAHQTEFNTALLNVAGLWDGYEVFRFRTINNTSYFNMMSSAGGKIRAAFVQEGEYQLFLSSNTNNSIGIATNTPNINAKLHVVGNLFSQGKVYIGTPDATTMNKIAPYSLAVDGAALFTKAVVKLKSNWPDYVFDASYKIPKLSEIETFIKRNGHLPEMPTASEVEKNGIDLGENQVTLLKKIEELTLILIELEKKVEKLENGVNK